MTTMTRDEVLTVLDSAACTVQLTSPEAISWHAQLQQARAAVAAMYDDRDNLAAENARLQMDADRWNKLVELVHAEEFNGWDVLVPGNLPRDVEGNLVAAIDAAIQSNKEGRT